MAGGNVQTSWPKRPGLAPTARRLAQILLIGGIGGMATGQIIGGAVWPGSKRATHFRRKLPEQVRRIVDIRFDQEAKGREALDRWSNECLEFSPRRSRLAGVQAPAPSPQFAILAQQKGGNISWRESPRLEGEGKALW